MFTLHYYFSRESLLVVKVITIPRSHNMTIKDEGHVITIFLRLYDNFPHLNLFD